MDEVGPVLPGLQEYLRPATAAELVMTPEISIVDRRPKPVRVVGAIPEVDIDTMLLEGKRLDADVRPAITGGDGITRTMDGASTVQFDLIDQHHDLMRSGIFQTGVSLDIDGLGFNLVGVDRNGDIVTLTFEDQEINWLRGYDDPLKAWKDRMTRGEFIHWLLREVKEGRIKLFCPDEHNTLPMDADAAARLQGVDHPHALRTRNRRRRTGPTGSIGRGVSSPAKKGITFKGRAANKVTLAAFNTSMDEALRLRVSRRVMEVMVTAGIGESGFDPAQTDYRTHTHKGVFQSDQVPQFDTRAQAHYFLIGGRSFLAGGAIGYCKKFPQASHGEVAGQVEISNGSSGYYESFAAEAKSNVDKWLKGNAQVPASSGSTLANVALDQITRDAGPFANAGVQALGGNREVLPDKRVKRLAFQRGYNGQREDSWTCIKRLAGEPGVNWNPFMVNGWLYLVSDYTLLSLAVQATINPDTPGVHEINYSIDSGKKVQEVTITCQADRWSLPPGSHVFLDEKNDLDIYGDWLIREINRPMFSADANVILRRGKQLTFAPKVKVTKIKPGTTTTVGGGSSNPATRAPGTRVSRNGAVLGGIFLDRKNWAGQDRGVDFSGKGDVTAFASGVFTNVVPTNSGWPLHAEGDRAGALMCMRLDQPVKGVSGAVYRYIYYAENIKPRVRIGQRVNAGDVVAYARGVFAYTEQGFAGDSHGNTYASLHGQSRNIRNGAGHDFQVWIGY